MEESKFGLVLKLMFTSTQYKEDSSFLQKVMKMSLNPLDKSQCQNTKSRHWYPYILSWYLLGKFVKDHSNFYLVIMSLILITFSLDLCIDTVRRNWCWSLLGLIQRVNYVIMMVS